MSLFRNANRPCARHSTPLCPSAAMASNMAPRLPQARQPDGEGESRCAARLGERGDLV